MICRTKAVLITSGSFPDPGADPTSRSPLGFYKLHHRSVRVQHWGIYLLDPPGGLGFGGLHLDIRGHLFLETPTGCSKLQALCLYSKRQTNAAIEKPSACKGPFSDPATARTRATLRKKYNQFMATSILGGSWARTFRAIESTKCSSGMKCIACILLVSAMFAAPARAAETLASPNENLSSLTSLQERICQAPLHTPRAPHSPQDHLYTLALKWVLLFGCILGGLGIRTNQEPTPANN